MEVAIPSHHPPTVTANRSVLEIEHMKLKIKERAIAGERVL